MLKLLGSLIIMAILLVPAFVFAGESVLNHPIFQESNWIFQNSEEFYLNEPDNTKIVWSTQISYTHPNGRYFMNVYMVFGETVFKGFSIYGENGNLYKHWFQLENNGTWFTVETEYFVREWLMDYPSGKVVAVTLILEDENGREIVRREVKRKDVAPAAISEKEKQLIDKWIQDNNLNLDGGPKRERSGPTSMFHDRTGKTTDRYEYILKNNPDRPWFRN